ncbi:isopentenyl-diphosphate Delta-isomerase [Williamsia phyllosphaerae]|uniref:Isopentenyl-diphosphate Delta-isomerase n=2 Tax=Williamsia phyllosphaerae TaxID=885042 RepID=A0ABQ1V5C6_9NOCA|nr:isopentenyl-diphosphate Delta-isomerase [Williamsia phyllosphaerae]
MLMENVVLLDDAGNRIGVHPKYEVHTRETPLHLAFSSYVFDSDARVLVTQRAYEKVTWPGTWTNSCCGHPGPDEPMDEAILRRLATELGIAGGTVQLLLPAFRYRAVMDNGLVENEICPVYAVRYDGPAPTPDPGEVADFEWVAWNDFAREVLAGERPISPWCRDQIEQLDRLGPNPLAWSAAPESSLPPAARTGLEPASAPSVR